MTLSKEQLQSILTKLDSLKHTECIVCKSSNWLVNDALFELREFQGGNMVIGGKSKIIPLLPITCNTCGNTILLNAVLLKLVESNNNDKK